LQRTKLPQRRDTGFTLYVQQRFQKDTQTESTPLEEKTDKTGSTQRRAFCRVGKISV
jgi:hypothetical protein